MARSSITMKRILDEPETLRLKVSYLQGEIERLRREYEEAAEAHGQILEENERLRAALLYIADKFPDGAATPSRYARRALEQNRNDSNG